jgi:hypothetical protein
VAQNEIGSEEHRMSATSESVTWKNWSTKWGDWATWFPKTVRDQSTHSGLRPQLLRRPHIRKIHRVAAKQAMVH